jgi:hypothetical protein
MLAIVYDPAGDGDNAAREIVPVEVIGEGDANNPVPADMLTLPPPVAEMMILPRPSSTIVTFGPSTRFNKS